MGQTGRLRLGVVASIVALFASAEPRAHAQATAPSADALIEHGVELREQGHDDLALHEFERALAIDPTPRARAQLALAEQALGHFPAAERHLSEALAATGDAWVEAHRPVLERAAAAIAMHLGSLEVSGGPAGAEIAIDGTVLGTLPLSHPLRLETGPRLLEVRHAGYYPVLRSLVVSRDTTAREAITLAPFPVAEVRAPAELLPSAPSAGPLQPASTHVQRTLAFTGFAAAGALVATGVVGLAERQSAVSAYNADSTCLGVGAVQSSACSDRISAASTWLAVGIVSFVSAGVLAGVSTVLLVTAPRSSSRGVACSGGPFGVACEGRF